MKSPLIYRTKSNIQSSYSIKEKYEQDYLELRDILKKNNVSIGDYLVNAYQELESWYRIIGGRYKGKWIGKQLIKSYCDGIINKGFFTIQFNC